MPKKPINICNRRLFRSTRTSCSTHGWSTSTQEFFLTSFSSLSFFFFSSFCPFTPGHPFRPGEPLRHPGCCCCCCWFCRYWCCCCCCCSCCCCCCSMIIWRDQPLVNDHPEGPASCKWSSVTPITELTSARIQIQCCGPFQNNLLLFYMADRSTGLQQTG